MESSPRYRFGNTVIDAALRHVEVDGRPAKLGARAFDLLLALVERRDRVVSKNELLDIVWPKLVVEENNLQVQVGALRKLLGPHAIATIPGRGYRFAQPLAEDLPVASPPDASPAPAPVSVRNGNLPAVTPPLFGRDADLVEVARLVDAHRVVSIVGAGGIGKTAFALAVAASLRERFPDGVWWIELAALTDGSLVRGDDRAHRGRGPGLGPPGAGSARDRARGRPVAAGARQLRTPARCHRAGRRPVGQPGAGRADSGHLAGDVEGRLRAQLPTGHADGARGRMRSFADAQRCGAVALFVERAAAADPRFRLTTDMLPAVADVCTRLDGIPLAIELAAARVPLLGVDGLRARLDERFRLLTAGARTVLRRHQTLRAALEWSHGLLGEQEQVVFRRLGACAGGFTLELAQQLAADGALDEWAVLDALGQLVDKSLVMAEGAGVPRYRLLETTRAFAVERLAASGEMPAVLRRHAQVLSSHCCNASVPVNCRSTARTRRASPSRSTTCARHSSGRQARTATARSACCSPRSRAASG